MQLEMSRKEQEKLLIQVKSLIENRDAITQELLQKEDQIEDNFNRGKEMELKVSIEAT